MQEFGGDWTEKKLDCIKKYLQAYTKIMSKQKFRFAYIDAFAGTGYRKMKIENEDVILFPELAADEPQGFLNGSVRIALQTDPKFTKYIFIEKDETKCEELNSLKSEFPGLIQDIIIVNADANAYIFDLCTNYNWQRNRAVLFLDPFGMQVEWKTIKSIADTKAIDLWILFPLGIGVNRLLKKDGRIKPSLKEKLDKIFGTDKWYDEFYTTQTEDTLFGKKEYLQKNVDFKKISEYFLKRLKGIFPGVAKDPFKLKNSKNNPLFLLCFAAGNKKGSKTAVKIAEDIISKMKES